MTDKLNTLPSRLLGDGKSERKYRPSFQLAGHADRATVGFHPSLCDCQPHSCTLHGVARGEVSSFRLSVPPLSV